MTYDYADWDDDNYGGIGGTDVTFSLSSVDDGDENENCAIFTTQALDGAVALRFTLAPRDTVDFLARFLQYTGLDVETVTRVARDAAEWRAQRT